MISVRIVNVDYYMNPPLHNLDIRYSEFRAVEVKQVPVIQVFGALQTGHKTCVNIHGVLPYIYIPYDGSEPAGSLSYKIAAELDKALNTSLGQASSNTVHVHNIVLVSSRPFYGYHEKNHQFFKLYFYNPHILKKACSLLENGAILGKIFQPFESHINYILQFMIDYNLFGMSFLNISGALYRPNPADPNLLEDLPSYLVLPKNIPRRSTCKYELDVLASNILNKDEISSGKVTVNPGIAALWADEKQRRRDKEEDSQISFKLTQERHEIPPTDSHNYFANLLTEKLSQKSDESSLDLDKSVYPAETPECSDIINANHSILDVSLSNETIVQTDEDAKLLKVLQELKASSKVEDERLLKVLQEPKAGGEVEEDRLLKVLQELKTEEVEVNQVEGDSVLNQMTQEEAESSDEDLDLSLPLKNAILEDDSIWENSFWDECEKIPQIDGQYDTDSDENELETEIDLRMADEVYIGINNFQKSPRRKLNRGLNKLIVLPRKLSKNEEKKVEILEEVFIKPAQQKEDLEKNDCKQLCLQDDSFDENNENVVINDVNLASSSPFEKTFADLSFESLLEADATPDFSSLGGTTNELKSDDYCSSQIIEDDFDNLFQSEENLAPSPEIPPNFDTFDELLLIANEIHENVTMPTRDSEIFAQKDEEIDELPLQENHTTNINEEIIKLPKFNIVENKNKNKKRERIKKPKTKRQLKKVVKTSENEEISSQENDETEKTKIRRSSAVKKKANKKNRNSTSRPKNDESSENEEISAQRNVKKGKTKTPKLNTVKSIIKGESKNGKTSIVEEISTEENPKIKKPRGRPKKKKNTPKRSHKSSEDMLDIKVPREMIDLVMQIKSCPKLVEKFEAKSNVSLEEEKISKLIQLKEDSEDERSAEVNKNEFITLEVTKTIEQQIVQDNVIIVQKRLSIENYAKELQKENKNLPEIFIDEENERNEQLNDNLTQEKGQEKIERTNKAEIDNQKAALLSNSLQDNIEENIPYSLEINNNSIEVKIAIEKIREMKGLPDLEGMDKYVEKKTSFVPKQNSVIEEIKSPIIVKLPLSSINRQALKQKISSTGKLKTLEKTSKLDKEISSGNKVEESVCSNISVEEILTKAKTKLEEMSLNSIEEDLTVPNKEEIRRKLREKIRRKRSIVNEELIPKLAKVSINKQSISSPIMISSDRSSSESSIDIKKLTRSCQKWNLDGQGDTTTTDSTSSEEKKETNNKKSAKVFKKKNKSTCRAPGLAKKSTKKSKRKVKFSAENQTSEEEDSELKIDTSKSRKPIICKDIKIVLTPVSALDIKQVQFLSSSENEEKISSKNNNFSTEKISKDLLNIETSLASTEEENITKKLLRKDEIIKKKHRTPSVSSLSSETSENPLKSQIQLSSSTEEENTKKKRIIKKQIIKKKQRTLSLSSSSSDEETKLTRLKSTRRSLTKYPKLSTKKLVDYTKEVQDEETEIEALVRTKTKIKRKPKKGSSTTSAKNPNSEESVSSKPQTSQEESTEDKSQQKLNSEEENLNASSKKPEKDEFINVIRQGKRTRKSPVRYKDEFTTSRKENASQKSVSSKSKLSNIEESPQSEMSSPETKKSPETNKNEAKRLSNKTAQKEDKSKVSNIEELPEISSKISKINTAKRIPMIVLTRVTPEQLSQNSIITISSSSSDENKEKKKIKIDTHSENKTLAKRDVESRKKIVNNSSPARYTALNVTRSPRKLRNLDQTDNEPVAKKQRCIPEGISPIVTTEQNNEPKEILDVKSAQGTGEWQKIEIILKNSEKTTPPKLNTEKCVPKNCDIVNNQNNLNSPNSIKQQLFNSTINYSKNYSSTPKSKTTPLRDINGNFDHIQEIRKREEQFLQEFDQNNSTDITNHQNIEIYHKTVNNNLEINSGSNSSSKNVNITENNILEISQSPVKLINQVNPYKPVKRKDKKPVPFTEARDFDYIYFSPIKKKVTKNTSNDIIETLSQQDAKVLQNIDEFNTKITNLTVAELYDLQKDFAPQPCCSKTVQEENSPVLFSNDFSLFENTLEETINEIIVEETEPETVNYSYNCWMPKFLPPSKEHILKTLKNYNIPENRFQEPFYSNCTDVTGTIDIGNNVLKISSNTATDFDEFNCCVEFIGLEKWRKNKFKEICPTDTTIKNIKVTLAGHKRIVITPVIQPPKREVILKWIEDENNKIEAKQNKIEKPRIIIPQSPTNSNDSFNESLTLTPDTPQSSKQSQNIIDSSQTPSKKFRSQNLQRKVLFPQKPNSNDSCRITGVTLDNSHDFKMSFANYQDAKAISEPENLTILVVELHIRTRGDFYPDPKYDSIRAIFYSILNDVPENFELPQKETGILVVDSLPGSPSKENLPILNGTGINCNLIYVKSELELIEEFIKLIRKWDPDIFTGFEIELLSWGYLIERCYVLEINLPIQISRINPDVIKNKNINLEGELRLTGRIILDGWRLFRNEIALQSYTFENLMFHILHQRVPAHSFKNLSFWWEHRSNYYRYITVNYYLTRVEGILKLFEQLDVIGRTCELARLFGIQFYEVLSRGSQFRVESMMLRLAKPLNFVPVSPSVQQRAKMRAPEWIPLIFEPESRFYSDPIIVLDFQSLYPSIIIAYNYCFSTCIGRVQKLGTNIPFEFGACQLKIPRKLLEKLQDKINFSPCGVGFVKPEIRKGILPQMLTEILETRLMVKASMKENKNNKLLQRVLHNRQLGLKLIANVTYGYTSANFSGRMPCIEIADSVVSKGRETLERAIKLIDQTDKWCARVVYGDTDSLFVQVPGRTKEDAFKIGAEIAEAVTNANPPPVKLKLEKIYMPCILQTKKRYVGYMYESPDQKEAEYNAKGIETVRRDGCPAVAKMLEKSLRILFETKDMSLVKRYTLRQFEKLLTGRASIQDLTFAKEFRGLSGYRPGACVPALELARRWTAVDHRREPRRKERVPYIIVHGPPGVPLIRLVKSPMELLNPEHTSLRPNAVYYITRVIAPPLNRCLRLIGADVLAWFNDMPRKKLQILPTDIHFVESKKSTISQYFATMSCVVCNNQTRDGLCEACCDNPQQSMVVLHGKLQKWERSFDEVGQICQSCCGRSEHTDCISLDCPVLYRLHQIKKDLKQVPFVRNLFSKL